MCFKCNTPNSTSSIYPHPVFSTGGLFAAGGILHFQREEVSLNHSAEARPTTKPTPTIDMAVNGEPQSQTRASRAYSFGQRQVDRVISPQSREGLYDAINQFATQRPILFAFIVSQLIFSALPLALFISFSISTAAFAIVSATLFCVFWIGVGLLVLCPILFVTSGIAVLVWVWAVVTFIVGRKVYQMLPVSLQGDMQVKMPSGKQVIFQKERKNDAGSGFDDVNIKEEAADVRD